MLAYYGFAGWQDGWKTLDWLRQKALQAPRDPETFAKMLANELESELQRLGVSRRLEYGIGIHFAAYERIAGYWIPELFHVSNWAEGYAGLRPDGVGWSRDSYPTMFPDAEEMLSVPEQRLKLRTALEDRGFLQFNNGDPGLFNPVARALHGMVGHVDERGALKEISVESWRALAKRPIEVISDVYRDFVRDERRAVGGRLHDLSLTPEGQYESASGDRP